MRRFSIARSLFVPLVVCLACVSRSAATQEVRSLSNAQFETVGLDFRSVSYLDELSLFIVQIAERHLEGESLDFPLPILVSLRPEEHVDFEGNYRIRIAERGAVHLDIRWEASLSLEQTCRALVEALVVQYAVFNLGPDSLSQIRAWPVEALSTEVYLALRPAMFVELLADTQVDQNSSLTVVSEEMLSGAKRDSSAGYWLMQVINAQSTSQSIDRDIFRAAVAGADVEGALVSAFLPNELTTGQDWWAGEMKSLLGRDYEALESMQISRAWIEPLTRFDQVIELETGEVQLNLRSLWTHREDPLVRSLIQARYEILRLRISRVNPAYFNTARSLGLLYESLLKESAYHTYVHTLAVFLSDWEDTKDMQAKLNELFESNE